MKMICPHCGVKGSADDSLVGTKVKCPKCLGIFEVLPEISQPAAVNTEELGSFAGDSGDDEEVNDVLNALLGEDADDAGEEVMDDAEVDRLLMGDEAEVEQDELLTALAETEEDDASQWQALDDETLTIIESDSDESGDDLGPGLEPSEEISVEEEELISLLQSDDDSQEDDELTELIAEDEELQGDDLVEGAEEEELISLLQSDDDSQEDDELTELIAEDEELQGDDLVEGAEEEELISLLQSDDDPQEDDELSELIAEDEDLQGEDLVEGAELLETDDGVEDDEESTDEEPGTAEEPVVEESFLSEEEDTDPSETGDEGEEESSDDETDSLSDEVDSPDTEDQEIDDEDDGDTEEPDGQDEQDSVIQKCAACSEYVDPKNKHEHNGNVYCSICTPPEVVDNGVEEQNDLQEGVDADADDEESGGKGWFSIWKRKRE